MMNDAPTIRKLRAIMFSDVVGYSKMMQDNESEALKLLQKHKDIVSEIAEKHGGKVIKYVGDEILVESESAVMLVYCAKELQKLFADRNSTVPKSRELWVRIGIHIGDVVIKEDDIFGDGVNIASRIRPLADPGGIVITHSVLILLGNQDDIRCNLIGNKKLKNIKERIKIYEVLLDISSAPSLGIEQSRGISRETFYKVILPIFMSLMFIFFLFFLIFRTNYSDYEEEYFRGNLKSTSRITRSIKSVKNVKANFFNIASANKVDAPSLENYYKQMISESSDGSEKLKLKFYKALSHLYLSGSVSRLDSAMILLKELDDAGVENLYFKISLLKLYRKLKIKTPAAELSQDILRKFPENPLAVFEAAETYKDIFEDLDRAKDLYRKTLDLFPQFCGSYIGLSEIEFMQRNYDKAVSLSDSALSMDPANLLSVKNAVRILKSTSSFEKAKKILDKLPRNSFEKYLEKAKISLLQNNPGEALVHIDAALYEFPDKQELVRSYNRIEKIITLSDSIQRIENTVTRGRNNWTESWNQAAEISSRQKKPIIVAAVDSESLSSKYLELALLERSTLRLTKEAIMLKLFKHKDHEILDELGVDVFPTLMFVTPEKEVISSFENSVDMLTDSDAVISFLTEVIFLNKKLIAINDDSERNRYKSANDFSYAEELALEHSLPIVAILTSNQSYASDVFLKQTVFNPGFMSNYNGTVLLSIENAEESDLAKKYKIKKFPTVLIFDQDINLVSARYGIVPQKVLAEEINRVKLFRKMNEKIKESVNWLYDVKEALYFADKDQKPIFAYIADGGHDVYKPKENIYSSYEVIKKINTKFIPLFLSEYTNKSFFNKLDPEFLPAAAVLDNNGNIIYNSYMPDKTTVNELLDYRMNANMAVSLGSEEFKNIQNFNRMLRNILDGGLVTSAYNGLLSGILNNPGSTSIYNGLGKLFLSLNDFSSAVYYLKALRNKDFLVTDEYLRLLVTSSILWDDFFRLDEFLNHLLKKHKNEKLARSSVFSALAEIYLAENETIDAINYAAKALELAPVRSENLNLIGILNYTINKDKAEEYFKTSLVVDPKNTLANAYLYNLTDENKYLTAAKRSYHSGDTDFLGLRYFDCTKEFKNPGLLELTERAYRIRLSIYPYNADFRLDIVKFLADNDGNLSEALETINILLNENPENVDYLTAASWVFYNLGDYSEADRMITKAFSNLSPDEHEDFPEVFYYMGMIKSSIGDNRSARYYFEKLDSFKTKNDISYSKLEYAQRFIETVH